MKFYFLTISIFCINFSFAQDCKDFYSFPLGENVATVFYDNLKATIQNDDYETALSIWKVLYKYASVGDTLQYLYGSDLYAELLNRTKDDDNLTRYYQQEIDKLFERHLICISPILRDSGKVLENYAYTLSEINHSDFTKTLSVYQQAIKINGNKTSPYILAYYADHVLWMYEKKLVDFDFCKNVYLQIEYIKDANIKDKAYVKIWEEYIFEYFDEIPPVRTFDCEFYERKMRYVFEQNPTNKTEIQKMIDRLEELDCCHTYLYETLKSALKNIDE